MKKKIEFLKVLTSVPLNRQCEWGDGGGVKQEYAKDGCIESEKIIITHDESRLKICHI